MQPFTGVKVIDLTHILAGPFCTYQLAVLGADVIKVEAPAASDSARVSSYSTEYFNTRKLSTSYLAQGANKKAITLNLKSAEGRDLLKRLASDADVFVENFTAGTIEKLGLGYEDIAEVNPRIVYCSLTGFGQDGPKRGHPAYDNVIQALSGLMANIGSPDTGPLMSSAPILDYATGIMGSYAIACALLQRARTGAGQRIDVSMVDASLMLMSSVVSHFLNAGIVPEPQGNVGTVPTYSCYETRAGLLMIGASNGPQIARLWEALGISPALFGGRDLVNDREANALARSIIGEKLRERTADEWASLLVSADVPAERVMGVEEALAHPQLQGRPVLQRIHHPDLGREVKLPVAAFAFAHGGPALVSPPPSHGEHTDEILAGLGIAPAEITRLRRDGVV
jgi:crotonobetainyl-CoA:carnitine CoA-transferase CaiB-like acyl-CoA transferase